MVAVKHFTYSLFETIASFDLTPALKFYVFATIRSFAIAFKNERPGAGLL
jgi:hypothetical protein